MDALDFSRMSVAVVDDNRNFLRLMRSVLRSFRVEHIYENQDARETIDCLRSRRVDILLADNVMPRVSGLELIRMIRADRAAQHPGLPIICVSGHADRRILEDSIRAGADDFLVKPVRPVDIFRRIAKQISEPLPRVRASDYFGPDRRRGLRDTRNGPDRRIEVEIVEI